MPPDPDIPQRGALRPALKLAPLVSFVEIHDSASFQEAARRLNLSQSTISTQIRLLEEELGLVLFDRTARPPVITEAGRAVLGPAREILAQVRQIARIAAQAEGGAQSLRLGVIPTVATVLLPDALVALGRVAPDLGIAVESGLTPRLAADVRQGRLDVAVVTGVPALTEGLRSMLVLRERLVLVGRRGSGARLRLDALNGQPFLRFDPSFGLGGIIDALLIKRGITPRDVMQFDSVEAILSMAERGFGMGIVPEHAVQPGRRPALQVAPIPDVDASREVLILWRDLPGRAEAAARLTEALRRASAGLTASA